jgi:3-deoxy-D-manno-octulosonic-acid transferase
MAKIEKLVLNMFPLPVLVIAPRHEEGFNSVEMIARLQKGVVTRGRSHGSPGGQFAYSLSR